MITNFGFHILSLLVFSGLLYALIRLMSALRLSLLLSRSAFGSDQTVLVDWPLAFVARVCRLTGVPFTSDCSSKYLAAKRLDLKPWSLVLLAPELKAMRVQGRSSEQRGVIFRLEFRTQPRADVVSALQQLKQDFKNELTIETAY